MNLFNSWKSLFRVLVEKLEKSIPFNVISILLLPYNKISKLPHTYFLVFNLMDKRDFPLIIFILK